NNQDLALITKYGIFIYTIVEDFIRIRYCFYLYYYVSWNSIQPKSIQGVLDDEFNDSQSSLPLPNFETILNNDVKYKELTQYIINDPVELSKFGSKILRWAICYNRDDTTQLIFDNLFEFIKIYTQSEQCYNDICNLLFLISKELPELCNHQSNFLITKYISQTSILLAPFCSRVKDSENTSLCA